MDNHLIFNHLGGGEYTSPTCQVYKITVKRVFASSIRGYDDADNEDRDVRDFGW